MITLNIIKDKIKSEKTPAWGLFVISSILAVRLFHFAWKYSVNMLYSDQWDFYNPLFTHQNIWQIFTWQHGPHRQGIGLIVTKLIADSTRWNSKADSLAIVALLSMAMVFAYILKYKLFGSLTLWDLTIPLLFLTLFQYESIVVVPNLSYGAFPIMMIMLYCLTLLIRKNKIVRYVILLLLNFFLIYTGWGLFMGIVTIAILSFNLYTSLRDKKDTFHTSAVLIIALISLLLFFKSYQFSPAVSCFGFSKSYIIQYPVFMGLMLAAFFGWHVHLLGAFAIPAGLVLLTIVIFVLQHHGKRAIKHGLHSNQTSLIIIILLSYSLLFCINTAIGRVCTGLYLAQVSRYTTLLIPAFLAIYLHLITIKTTKTSVLILTSFITIASVGSLPLGIIESVALKSYNSKINWESCYLQTYDIENCNQLTGFEIYPLSEQLPAKLDYLKENQLNLFRDFR